MIAVMKQIYKKASKNYTWIHLQFILKAAKKNEKI